MLSPNPTPTHTHSPVSKFPGCSDLRNPKLRQGAETERLGLPDLAGASLTGYGWEGGALLLVSVTSKSGKMSGRRPITVILRLGMTTNHLSVQGKGILALVPQ